MGDDRQSTFTWIYATGAVVPVLLTIFAVTFAVQEHNDRVLSEEITGTASELQDTGARITGIRNADMKNRNDSIRAYSQLALLVNDYDRQVERTTDLYNLARERDLRLLRIERLYRRPRLTNWENMSEIFGRYVCLEQSLQTGNRDHTKHGSTPESERMQSWHEQFLPREAQEKGLRAPGY